MVGREDRKLNNEDSRRHPQPVTRALAFADIVGSTELVDAHELDAFRCVRRVLRVLRQEARVLDGRVVDEAGDGALVSFACPALAVRWALRVHEQVERRCRNSPPYRRPRLRIGVHVGEILLYGSRVFGRNVTVACRLQQAAAPGETLVSADVIRKAASWIHLEAAPVGQVALKGLPTSVAAFRVERARETIRRQDGFVPGLLAAAAA